MSGDLPDESTTRTSPQAMRPPRSPRPAPGERDAAPLQVAAGGESRDLPPGQLPSRPAPSTAMGRIAFKKWVDQMLTDLNTFPPEGSRRTYRFADGRVMEVTMNWSSKTMP